MPDPMPIIGLDGVWKTYGSGDVAVDALRGIDLSIQPGQFVVILGPSGSGKTTLLNVIGGIEPATQGRVTVAGQEVTGESARDLTEYRRTTVGFVFQFFNLVPTLTALENVQLVGELAGRSADDARAALEAVGLAERDHRFPASLSGGQQQRVAIARALVKRPPLLLCDEPTGSLDLETGRQVLGVIRELGRRDGVTVLLVTHNQAIAAMADRVIHVGSGELTGDERNAAPAEARELQW